MASLYGKVAQAIKWAELIGGAELIQMYIKFSKSKTNSNKSCQKPTIELAGRLREKLNISP